MDTTRHDDRSDTGHAPSPRFPIKTALLMVVLVGAVYLLREHWNHLAGMWVYLLLLACPLLHLFHGHGGHGGKDRHGRHEGRSRPGEKADE